MEVNNLQKILAILNDVLNNDIYKKDASLIKELYDKLNSFQIDNIEIETLNEVKRTIEYLDNEYNDILDLAYYFDPLYISLKKYIQKKEVEKLRKNLRKKKEGKKND